MIEAPQVSIVIPVYNHAAFLPRALNAIATQNSAPAEVIVVDDASTDGSLEVARGFAVHMPPTTRFEVVESVRNQGVNQALNRGLREVRSDYVVCTAADDWLRPQFISALMAAAARFPSAQLITSAYVEYFEHEDRTVEHAADAESGVWYAHEDTFFPPESVPGLLKRGPVTLPISASVLRTDTLRALGGFDPALKWHADWFVATAIALRYGFAVVPEHLAVFRIAHSSYSGGSVRDRERQRAVCRAINDKLATADFLDVRAGLLRRPAPFAPFIKYMILSNIGHRGGLELLAALCVWWLGQLGRARRPGKLRALASRLGVNVAPR